MLADKIKVTGGLNMDILYNKAVAGIEIILKHRYRMKVSDAKSAIAMSPLKELFEQNAEMAAHTSNETLAREIYEFWENLIFRPARSAKIILD